MKYSLVNKIGYIFLGCLQNMTMGGIIFGWSSILPVLLTSAARGGLGLSVDFVHLMFVAGSFSSFLGPLCLGLVLDAYGPRVCSTVSITFIIAGCLFFSLADISQTYQLLIGICLIAFGGPGVQSAVIHLSNLFPSWKASATAIITGSFQLSFFIFTIFYHLWVNERWEYRSIFLVYSAVCVLMVIASLVIWPDTPFTFEKSVRSLQSDSADSQDAPIVATESTGLLPKKQQNLRPRIGLLRAPSVMIHSESYGFETADLKSKTLYHQVCSIEFIELAVFFIISTYWTNFFLGTLDMQLGDVMGLNYAQRDEVGRLCTLAMTLGAVIIPLIGFIMDFFGFPITSLLTAVFGITWACLLRVETLESLRLSLIFYTLFRTFLFTFTFAYLADVLGFTYFGILAGLLFMASGFIGLTQYWLRIAVAGTCHLNLGVGQECSEGQWVTLHNAILVTFLVLPVISFQDYWRRRSSPHMSRPKSDFDVQDYFKSVMVGGSSTFASASASATGWSRHNSDDHNADISRSMETRNSAVYESFKHPQSTSSVINI